MQILYDKLVKSGIPTKNLPDAYDWHFAGTWDHIIPKHTPGWFNDNLDSDKKSSGFYFPKSTDLLSRSIAIMVFVYMDDDKISKIIDTIKEFDMGVAIVYRNYSYRGGSKGIPRKNIKAVFGKPLIYWSIQAAKKSKLLNKFYVSTEDPEIARISSEFGASVLKRPDNLSRDDSTTMAVLQHHFHEDLEGTEAIVLLQCTSPHRDDSLIDDCIKKYNEGNYDSLATGFHCTYEPWGKSNRPRQEIGGFL